MNIIYKENNGVLYSINIHNLAIEIYAYWEEISSILILGKDDISKRILQSQRLYTSYSNKQESQIFLQREASQLQPLAQVTVTDNAYDLYTNSDGIIHDYLDSYWGNYKVNDLISDDPVVRIIPKNLCFENGKYFYIGKEYGFFVSTTIDYLFSTDKCVDVFVFDIHYTNPSFENPTASVKITPLFQRRYRAIERSSVSNWNYSYDNNLDSVVFPHIHYDSTEYYLKDVSFKHTMFNQNALDKNETDYSPTTDAGSFFTTMQYSAVGTAKAISSNPFIDTLAFMAGCVRYVGDIVNVASYAHNIIVKESYNAFNVNTGMYTFLHTTRKAQMDYYGQLLKTIQVSASSANSSNPTLVGTHSEGNYVQSSFGISNGGDLGGKGTLLYHSIAATIVDDQTYFNLGGGERRSFYYGNNEFLCL